MLAEVVARHKLSGLTKALFHCGAGNRTLVAVSLALGTLICSGVAIAGCLDPSWCKSDCSLKPSLFGGMSGGIMGGIELSQCHSACDRKYKVCLARELATPEGRAAAQREAKEAAAMAVEHARSAAENQKQFEASLKKARSDSETAQRSEFRLLLAWYNEYGDLSDNRWPGASALPQDGDAIIRTSVPMRRLFPRPDYGSDTAYNEEHTAGVPPNKLNDDFFHIIGILPVGTRVHIAHVLRFGDAEVAPVDGEYAGLRGFVVAGALSAGAHR